MDEAILRVLEMVKDGTISPEEGGQLIDAMGSEKVQKKNKASKRLLKIKVDSTDGDKVDVKIPLGIAKLFLKDGKLPVAEGQLKGLDIDFDQLLSMLDEEMEGDLVNVDSAEGDKVRIFIE